MVSAETARGGLAGMTDPRQRSAFYLTIVTVFGVAVLPIALELSQPHGLYGVTQYDDGVYFAAALRLVSGVVPYRDFVLVQPPGILAFLSPFALLSHLVGARHALGAARIATAGVVGCTAALTTVVLRHRGVFAAGVAGLLLALYPTGYAADHTFLLEPYLDLCCVLGTVLVFSKGEIASPRRVLLGGVAFGVALSVKSFAIVPIAALGVVLALRSRRLGARFALGVGIALVVLVGPFLVAAPHAFVHDVISSQLARETVRPTPFVNRVFAITGLAYARATLTLPGSRTVVLCAGAVLASIVGAGIVLAASRRAKPLEWFALAAAIGVTAIMFVPAQYFDHYALFSAAFLALAIGGVAGHLNDAARAVVGRVAPARQPALVAAGTAVLLVVAILASVVVLRSATAYQKATVDRFEDPGPAIAAEVPAGSCVLSDAETVLVSAGRAAPGPAGCPAIVDATGTWLSYDAAHPPVTTGVGPKDPALVAFWRAAFSKADYVVLSGVCAFRIPWTPALYRYFDTHYRSVPGPYGLAFRRGTPNTNAQRPDLESRCAAVRARRASAG